MSGIFLKILNMSIAASWLILAVVLLRFALKKAPKWIAVLLWGIVALRLAVPFSLESVLSLIPSAETFSAHNVQYETPAVNSGIPAVDHVVNPILGETFAPNPAASVNPLYVWMFVAAVIWLMGITAMLLYALVSYVRVRRSVLERVPYEGNIFLCDQLKSPFILGLVRPKIYLPSGMDEVTMGAVTAHEKAHLARRDHWWKPMGFLILTVHWFNPLCWTAYVLLCRDIELACDEKVIRQMDLDGKKLYSAALLECSIGRRLVTACPLAFGEIGVKERVKKVLNYKKPAFWIIVLAVIACAAVAVCFATNPVTVEPGTPDTERPTLILNGDAYVDPYMPVSDLPYGYQSAGKLTQDQANNTGLEGIEYFMHPSETEDFYTYQECGTPIDLDTVDNEQRQWAYVRWVLVKNDGIENRKLTLDDVVRLSQKGDALTWSDFERYQGRDVGSGLYIMRYVIDGLFDVLVGGVPEETPMYIELRVHNEAEDHIDIRTGDVSAFIEAHRNDALKVDELSAALNKLEYQPYTCDGLPEYQLIAVDGTVYSINVTEKWVWRGKSEQAELSDELIRLLRESGMLIGGEDTSIAVGPDEADATFSEEQTAIQKAILGHNRSPETPADILSCCSFVTLDIVSGTPKTDSDVQRTTYYGWALYEEYRVTDKGLETVGSRHIPAALTFEYDDYGYSLLEYWEPGEGSYFVQDIREKFPAHIAEDGMDSQKFIRQQKQECRAQAAESAGLDTDKVIGLLIERICSSPALSSNPEDYIEEHSVEYRELIYYGRYTLEYCFDRFEKGGETGLEGHIMMRACEDIAAGWGEEPLVFYLPMNEVLTGQMWYDAFKTMR